MRCIYKLDFKTICPVDDEIIDYKCKILSNITIPVEILLKETDLLESTAIFQEDATRRILKTLVDFDNDGSYRVFTKGIHKNVKIKCDVSMNNAG